MFKSTLADTAVSNHVSAGLPYFRTCFLMFIALLYSASATAEPILVLTPSTDMVLCEGLPASHPSSKFSAPDFTHNACKAIPLSPIDPQRRHLWLKVEFDRPQHWEKLSPPYGLYVMGKAASRVMINGQILGSNGQPATDDSERPGDMDAVFYLPDGLIQAQGNTLVMELSGQHSVVELTYPMHLIGFGHYGEANQFVQEYSVLGLILSGAFIMGAVYFFTISIGPSGQRHAWLLAAMCLIAGLQLGAEISRGLLTYPYPWHDIRLLTVTALSLLFGMLILCYSSLRTIKRHALHWIYGGLLLSLLVIWLVPGFDSKTTAGVFIPLVLSLVQVFKRWLSKRQNKDLRWFGVQLLVAITIVLSSANFHEIVHFIIIAFFLVYLFVQQARDYRQQLAQLQQDQSLIAKLEYKLAQNTQSSEPSKLEISTGGKTEWIDANNIAYCKASGDYVELHLNDSTEKLYSGALKQLEALLPDTFIRVHRSYLVNLNEVVALSSKGGRDTHNNLRLSNQQTIPVSRRLMPTVRGSLKQASP